MEKKMPTRLHLTLLSIALAAAIVLAVTGVYHANSFRVQPIFLFMLLLGIGLSLAFGLIRGGLAGLILIAIFVGSKQAMGLWNQFFLLPNLLEIVTAVLAFFLAGIYHDRLKLILDGYYNNVARLEKLNLIDGRLGLIKEQVGKLRLTEEEERSVRYKRPFTLLLTQLNFKERAEKSDDLQTTLMRLLGNTLKGTTRTTDIPFQAASDKIALILPETNIDGARKVVDNIMARLPQAFYSAEGENRLLLDETAVVIGAASFTGFSRVPIDMFGAASESLVELNSRHSSSDILEPIWKLVGDSTPPVYGSGHSDSQKLQG